MIRISLPWIVDTVNRIDELNKLSSSKTLESSLREILTVQRQLELVFNETFYKDYFNASRGTANELYMHLQNMLGDFENLQRQITDAEVENAIVLKDRFKNIFQADLGILPSYLVSKKGNYDIGSLIEKGDQLFPSTLAEKVPESISDAMEVGKALAFELPTACGFHAFRVTEAVVRRYWDAVSNKKERPEPETLGRFAAEMETKKFGDVKIYESLKQMTRLHRNPIAHPEYILTIEEAIGIIGIARSVIAAMLLTLPEIAPTNAIPTPP